MNVAKSNPLSRLTSFCADPVGFILGAKRIGLLFSSSQIDLTLDPKWIGDIPDITVGEEVFSDGCGLISKRLAIQVSKSKGIIFRGARYTPTVYQIRYSSANSSSVIRNITSSLGKDTSDTRAS